jgi:hypothetical protein
LEEGERRRVNDVVEGEREGAVAVEENAKENDEEREESVVVEEEMGKLSVEVEQDGREDESGAARLMWARAGRRKKLCRWPEGRENGRSERRRGSEVRLQNGPGSSRVG